MLSKMSFYALLHVTFLTMASQHDHTVLFTKITTEQDKIHDTNGVIMVIQAQPALDLPANFIDGLHFRQTDQGTLLALYLGQQQQLGRWPHRIIQTYQASMSEEKGSSLLQIEIPYIPIIKTPS